MKEIVATLTPRGQVTVPPEVQQLLGVQPNGKITFRIEDGQVRLVPAIFTLETAYQSVPPLAESLSDEEMTRIAKEERAERFARRLREP